MAATRVPNGMQQFLDQNGAPLVGGFVYHYVPGGSTPLVTYSDVGLSAQNANPIVLGAGAYAAIWCASGTQIRQVVQDLNHVQIWDQVTST